MHLMSSLPRHEAHTLHWFVSRRCHSGLPPALIPTHPEDETEDEDEEDDERMVLDGLEDETEQMAGGKQAMEEEVAAPVPMVIDRRASDTDLTAGAGMKAGGNPTRIHLL